MSEGIQAMWQALDKSDPKQGKIDQEIEYFMTHFFDNARNIVYERELAFQREREQAYSDHYEQKSGTWNESSLFNFCKSKFMMSDKNARICANGVDSTRAEIASQSFPQLPQGFWYHGKEGTRKTTTAGGVTVEYMKGFKLKFSDVSFYTWQELYEKSNKTKSFNSANDYKNLLVSKFEGVKILILDDFIRTEDNTISDQLKFALALINYVIAQNMCLIVTSNASPREIEIIEEDKTYGNASPVVSRLSRYCKTIEFKGEDSRGIL